MIIDALWVSYVTRNAFLNSLFIVFFHVSFQPIPILRCFSFVIPQLMGPSIENSHIAFIQRYVSKNKVGYVSFARVFFLSTL